MRDTSLQAYTDSENTKRRVSAKRTILSWLQLFSDDKFTAPEIFLGNSKHGIDYQTTLKRLSDLSSEGKIKAVGTKEHSEQSYTLWQFDPTGNAKKRVSWKEAYEQAIDENVEICNELMFGTSQEKTRVQGVIDLMVQTKRRAAQIKNGEG